MTIIHYLVRLELDAARARRALETTMRVLGVTPVDGEVMRRALALGWPDFEDAVTAAAAERAQCDAIVTRDPKGCPGCPTPVLTPQAAVAWLSQV